MREDPELNTSHGSDIFRMVKKKITGLSPSASQSPAKNAQNDLPADYEASVREVVGKIKQLHDTDRKNILKGGAARAGSVLAPDIKISAPYVKTAGKQEAGNKPAKPGAPGTIARPRSAGPRQLSRDEQFHEQITRLYYSLDNEDVPMAVTTIDTMGSTMNVSAAEVLAILLEYPDEDIRVHSAIALGKLGQRATVEPLIKALDDKSSQVSENAAIALGAIGDNRAEIPLQKVPVDNPRVKRAAVNALARIENKRI